MIVKRDKRESFTNDFDRETLSAQNIEILDVANEVDADKTNDFIEVTDGEEDDEITNSIVVEGEENEKTNSIVVKNEKDEENEANNFIVIKDEESENVNAENFNFFVCFVRTCS